jgi:hypothetical protein
MTADIAQYFDDSSTVFIADSPIVVTLTETPGARDTVRISYSAPYKIWSGLVYQTGTSTPTFTELENTLGEISFSYSDVGTYTMNCTDCFTTGKTVFQKVTIISPVFVNDWLFVIGYGNEDLLNIESFEGGVLTNHIIHEQYIEIKVYY